jgi:hypothetical protein
MSRRPVKPPPKPLNAELYSPAQVLASQGLLPADHAAWNLNERDEARYIAAMSIQLVPEFRPPTREAVERVVVGSCGCGTHWRGELVCHCAACHLTFRSGGGFDEHRTGGRCRTEAELTKRGLEPNAEGQWRHPRPLDSIPGRSP